MPTLGLKRDGTYALIVLITLEEEKGQLDGILENAQFVNTIQIVKQLEALG